MPACYAQILLNKVRCIMAKKTAGTRVRDAKNGRFLPKGTDKRRPATTVKETVKPRKRCK